MTTTHAAAMIRETGRLLTRMTPEQIAKARAAAAAHGVPVTQWLRERIVTRILGGAR